MSKGDENVQHLINILRETPNEFLVFLCTVLAFVGPKLWKYFIQPIITKKVEDYNNQQAALRNSVSTLQELNIDTVHKQMQYMYDKICRSGARDNYDTRDFCDLYHSYKALGGNHDGDVLYEDFLKLPHTTSIKIPVAPGHDNPPTNVMEAMVKYYERLCSGVIPRASAAPLVEGIDKGLIRDLGTPMYQMRSEALAEQEKKHYQNLRGTLSEGETKENETKLQEKKDK